MEISAAEADKQSPSYVVSTNRPDSSLCHDVPPTSPGAHIVMTSTKPVCATQLSRIDALQAGVCHSIGARACFVLTVFTYIVMIGSCSIAEKSMTP